MIKRGGAKDNKPIINYSFFIKNPEDLAYEIGTEEHELRWTIISTSPKLLQFYVLRDGTSVKIGNIFWGSNEIIINVDGMNKATEEMFNDLLSTAKILVEAPNNVNWDLAHYIADNTIGKIMMLKLHEDKGYSENMVENLSFPTLVKKFEKEYPSFGLDYEEIKEQHKEGRNPFQHKLITNYLGIRQPQARLYVQILHQLMEIIGILNPKPNYSINSKSEIPKYPLDPKNEIEFFIERISQKDYETILNRFYDKDFKKIFDNLFTKIDMGTGYLNLTSNSFVFVIGVNEVFSIKPLYKQEEKYRKSWENMTTAEKINIFPFTKNNLNYM